MINKTDEVVDASEVVEEYPDTLIDRVGIDSLDNSGEEIDVEGFFARDLLLEPEKRLMFAVLELAVDDFMKFANSSDSEERRKFHRTVRWIHSDDVQWPYSFIPLCHTLGVDENNLRGKLSRWRRLFAPDSYEATKKR